MKNTTFLITLIVVSTVLSCNKSDSNINEEFEQALQDVVTDTPEEPPLSLAILDDRSGTRFEYGIPPLTKQMLQPYLNYIKEWGGSLMVGIIASNSEKIYPVFLRVPPVKLDVPKKPETPERRDYNSDFSFSDAMDEYRIRLKGYNEQIGKFEQRREKIKARNDTLVSQFLKRFEALMNSNFESNKTDIHNAINKSVLFHDDAIEDSRKITILLSDGIHNQWDSKLTNPKKDEIEYYLVPGSEKANQQWIKETGAEMVSDYHILVQKILGLNYYLDS